LHCGLEYGFLKGLLAATRKWTPAAIIVCWDGVPKRCKDIYPEYKANRTDDMKEGEAAWDPRLQMLRSVIYRMTPSVFHPEEEADEQIARFVSWAETQQEKTLILSNDKDMQQLISHYTHVDNGKMIFETTQVVAEWGVPPHKLGMLRALSGDTSDNIKPPADRVTKKVKARLVQESESLHDLFKLIDEADYLTKKTREKLQAGKEAIVRNFTLMNLRGFRPNPTFLAPCPGDSSYVYQLCEQLEFHSLLSRKEFQLYRPVEKLGIGGDDVAEPVHSDRPTGVGSVHPEENPSETEKVSEHDTLT
jgi:5'-3' exonuclease